MKVLRDKPWRLNPTVLFRHGLNRQREPTVVTTTVLVYPVRRLSIYTSECKANLTPQLRYTTPDFKTQPHMLDPQEGRPTILM